MDTVYNLDKEIVSRQRYIARKLLLFLIDRMPGAGIILLA
jgi:hypothetical protein